MDDEQEIDEMAKALDTIRTLAEGADDVGQAERGRKITTATTVAVRHLLLGIGWALEPADRGELLAGSRVVLVRAAWKRLMDLRVAFEATLPPEEIEDCPP